MNRKSEFRWLDKRDVLLVDADDQKTAVDFTLWRDQRTGSNAGYTTIKLREESVRSQILRLSKNITMLQLILVEEIRLVNKQQ